MCASINEINATISALNNFCNQAAHILDAVNTYCKENENVSSTAGFIEDVSLTDLHKFVRITGYLIQSEIDRLTDVLDATSVEVTLPDLGGEYK